MLPDADALDRAFLALADPVRRGVVARLSTGPATVNELAAPFDITVQAVSRHIKVLEEAGLVTRSRDGQRRPVHLAPAALERLTAWIDWYRLEHERRFRRLDAVLRASGAAGSADTVPGPSAADGGADTVLRASGADGGADTVPAAVAVGTPDAASPPTTPLDEENPS